jgi:gamma-glutamylcyclotransferase (GGCT)/AIG2-like uncharacterized protein YtfP
MNEKFYLAYGSNLNLKQMAMRCPDAKVVDKSILENYFLLFRGAHESAVATVEPMNDGNVPVLIWEISPTDEAELDRYEGFPFFYRKEKVKVQLAGKTITGMIYIMNEGRSMGTPSCYYYSVILEGYKTANFDINILRAAVNNSKEVDS